MGWDPDKLHGILFEEPLSAITEGRRKTLLFVSSFSILITVYGVQVNKTPWLDIEVPPGAPGILHGTVSVALVYSLISFVLHSLADLRRWFAAGEIQFVREMWNPIHQCRNHLETIRNYQASTPDIQARAIVQENLRNADEFLVRLQDVIAGASRGHHQLAAMQCLRLLIVDLGVPLALGFYALATSWPSIGPFISVVWKAIPMRP